MHVIIPTDALKRLSVALRAVQKAFRDFVSAVLRGLRSLAISVAVFIVTHRRGRLDLIEAGGIALVMHGIWAWSVPSAYVIAGLAVVAAAEVRS